MAIRIELKFEMESIEKFSAIPKEAAKAAFELVALEYQALVRDGVDDGKSPDGKPFRPYKKEYADLKRRAGRKVVIDKPDLNLTGEMWRSMTSRISHGGALRSVSRFFTGAARTTSLIVDFPGTHSATRFRSAKGPTKGGKRSAPGQRLTVSRKGGKRRLNSVIAEYNDRIRPFIGVSPTGLNSLFRLFLRSVRKTIGKGKT